MAIKFLQKEKDEPRYLVAWETGYIQLWEDWSQFFCPKRYNWLNFRPIWFEIDYDKLADEHLGIEFGLLGFNFRFHQFIRDNESGREMAKRVKEMETISQAHKKEVNKLKKQIAELKEKLRNKND